MRTLLMTMALVMLSTSAFAAKFEIDPAHTSVNFTAQHLMISKVKGRFEKFTGSFDFDEKSMKLDNIQVVVKTESISTNEKDRDKHLRSPDFFDVAKFPDMTFKSTKVIYDKDKPDKVEGNLTIRGVTKAVTLDLDYNGAITDAWGNRVVSFQAEGKIDRKDFGLIWNKALDKGGVTLGDEIKIEIEGEGKVPSPKK
jgi:polyisoprenoid-binding protein YceI